MADRPKISVKPTAAPRDPFRPRVRGVASPRPPAPARGAAPPPSVPAAPRQRPDRPPRNPQEADPRPAPRSAGQGPRPDRGVPPRRETAPRPQRVAPVAPVAQLAPQTPQPMQRPARPPKPAPTPHADGVRVSKLITERGLASRREADDWIDAGWVRVNGQVAVLGQRARPMRRDRDRPPRPRRTGAQRDRAAAQAHRLRQRPGRRRPRASHALVTRPTAGRATPRASTSTAATCATWRRPGGWTSIPPGCSSTRRTAASPSG
jgi:23S rRNA pseudouridine2604 synthase